jgi:hypothetical protein
VKAAAGSMKVMNWGKDVRDDKVGRGEQGDAGKQEEVACHLDAMEPMEVDTQKA